MEQLDPTPMEMPLGARMPESLQDTIARMVRVAVQEETNEELESWDEANDFTEDDPDVLDFSPYEFDDLEQEGNPFIEMKDAPEPTDEPDEPPERGINQHG